MEHLISSHKETTPWRICTAPMMAWSDRHYRFFLRLISRRARLYTEMLTTGALLHGDRGRLLHFSEEEHPLALQIGGSEPKDLGACAALAEAHGYDEINLNVGCPSDRVQNGRFGACLMAEPELVAEGVAAMRARTTLPVTVKTRIGIDDMDDYENLAHFVAIVSGAGCETFIVHARKAWLKGLSPKENREIPPLRYTSVYRLKRDFPALAIVINGGITDLDQAQGHLNHVDGVMIGRSAYRDPYALATADARLHGDNAVTRSRHEAIRALLPYIERELRAGTPLKAITRHLLGLFQGQPRGRAWRRYLSENAHQRDAGPEVLENALALVPDTATPERGEAA